MDFNINSINVTSLPPSFNLLTTLVSLLRTALLLTSLLRLLLPLSHLRHFASFAPLLLLPKPRSFNKYHHPSWEEHLIILAAIQVVVQVLVDMVLVVMAMVLVVKVLILVVTTEAKVVERIKEVIVAGSEVNLVVSVGIVTHMLVSTVMSQSLRVTGTCKLNPHPTLHEKDVNANLSHRNPKPQVDSKITDAENANVKKPGPPVQPLTLARRPGYGTRGREVILRTNYFELDTKAGNDVELYRYHVQIQPELTGFRRRRAMTLLLEQPGLQGGKSLIASDYRSIIVTPQLIPGFQGDSKSFSFKYFDEDEKTPSENAKLLVLNVKFVKKVNVSGLKNYLVNSGNAVEKEDILHSLNIVLSKTASDSTTIKDFGNKFFPVSGTPGTVLDTDEEDVGLGYLGGALMALRGYYVSTRTSTARLMVNVNVCTAAFFRSWSLVRLFQAFRMRNQSQYDLAKFIKGLRVVTSHIKNKDGSERRKEYRITGLGKPARSQDFVQDGQTTNVAAYFANTYGRLNNEDEVCIKTGSLAKPIYIPPELCFIKAGQKFRGLLTSDQVSEMIKVACKKPYDNANSINVEGFQQLGFIGNDANTTNFGLKVREEMMVVKGRVLEGPGSVVYKNNSRVTPKLGTWNLSRSQFFKAIALPKFKYVFIQGTESDGEMAHLRQAVTAEFESGLRKIGAPSQSGVPAELLKWKSRPEHGESMDQVEKRNDGLLEALFRKLSGEQVGLIAFILPRIDNVFIYNRIKFWGDVKAGIHTICMLGTKVAKDNKRDQYIANVLMKVNLKLRGINHQIPRDKLGVLEKNETIIMGMDVTHPSPGSAEGFPSIASVVASTDNTYSQWPASLRCQEAKKEMIENLASLVIERIRMWYSRNKTWPKNILIYRDGVSEGQYDAVLHNEYLAVQAACETISTNVGFVYRPKINLVVVGKRHHTRFYPTQKSEEGNHGNPKNGTVVDRGVTMEDGWDFFLQAHVGLQGTARPAHYVVLKNEMGLTADQMEQITHNLCYLYGRATKAVSICPPAYYADLACERGRKYLMQVGSERATWMGGVAQSLSDTMFYI